MNSRFAEAYRTLRTNIDFSFIEKDFRTLLVTSASDDEGKTVTVANLAYTISLTGKSVLMMDADLRRPALSDLASSRGSPGLTGLLSDVFSTNVRNGTLGQFGISDLFRLLSLQKKTGLLQVSGAQEEVELFFLRGDLVDLNWRTRPEKNRLATVLVKSGLITKEQARQAIMRQKDTGQKLGSLLINVGLLKKEDVTGALTLHMMEGLRQVLQFKDGEFCFEERPSSSYHQASFDPVDFRRLYAQVILTEEFPYLQTQIDSAVLETKVGNLFLLPCGAVPPNPSELLGSERMSFLVSYLSKRFDVLVIDSPPVLPACDAATLAPQADGVVLMIKAGSVNRGLVLKAVEQLQLARANLIGVVLSQVDTKRDGYYKYYYKHYEKYYDGQE